MYWIVRFSSSFQFTFKSFYRRLLFFRCYCRLKKTTRYEVSEISHNLFVRSAELQVDVHSIHHGNLLDPGTFCSHYTRGIPEQINEAKLTEHIKVLANISSQNVRSPMYVDFEHDRNIFTVRFAALDGLFLSVFLLKSS